jgi:hypothetical protein
MSHDDSSPNQTTPQDSLVVVTDVNVPQPEKTPTIPRKQKSKMLKI